MLTNLCHDQFLVSPSKGLRGEQIKCFYLRFSYKMLDFFKQCQGEVISVLK